MIEQGGAEPESRNAALDGLRALAISAVLLFHGGVGWLPGGFLGVDLFFVLSGYLITGLLLGEHRRTGRIGLLGFWSRRARRLLPALLVMVLVVVSVAAFATEGVPPGLRGDALATLGYVANWHLALAGGGYFAQQADPSALQHTWSLAIEEQFYLLWPLVVLLALRLTRGRHTLIGWLAALGLVASATGTAVASRLGADQSDLYYRTDTRAQALLVGALLAVVLSRRAAPLRWSPALAGLALAGTGVLWSQASGTDAWLYQGGLLAAALCAAGLVAVATTEPTGALGRSLGIWPLRSLGRISYGVYLWHWPVDLAVTAGRTGLHGPALLAARTGLAVALAAGSWFLLEQPVRRVARLPRLVLPTAVAAGLATALAVLALTVPATTHELPLAAATLAPEPTSAPTTTPTTSPTTSPTVRPTTTPTAGPAPTPSLRPTPPAVPAGPPVPVTVLGDSVADSLASGLAPVDQRYGAWVHNRGIIGCGIAATPRYRLRATTYDLADACRDWQTTWGAAIAQDRPAVALLVLGRHEVWDAELDGHWTHIGKPDFDTYLAGQLDRAIATAGAKGTRVAVATSPYFQGREAPDGSAYVENDPARVDRFNALVRAAVARHTRQAFVVELGGRCSPQGRYARVVDGVTIRKDGVHFSAAGARWLAPWLLPRVVDGRR